MFVFFPLAIPFILLLLSAPALAQDSRAEAIAAQQADKATRLTPQQRHWAEELVLTVQKTLVQQPSGFYPYFDSVYSGGGFTLGAGYRQFTGDRTQVNLAGLYSAAGYKLIEVSGSSPGHWSGRLDLHANAGWRDATQVSYYGLGIESAKDAGTAFRMQQGFAGGDLTLRPVRWLLVNVGMAYEDYTLKDPTGEYLPVEGNYSAETAPGVGADPVFLHSSLAVGIDSRPAADYARRGSLFQVTGHHFTDRDATYSFDRLAVEAVQHIPILRENWVISLRGRLESVVDDDDQVPYFLLPSLGSGSTLRGYASWRFRDRHAVLASAEWRWILNRMALDLALFADSGMVAPRFDALTTSQFVSDYGVGVRFHAPARTPLRVEFAHGREGLHIVFSASAAF
jgi:outer membrane protein assembly factor BamA